MSKFDNNSDFDNSIKSAFQEYFQIKKLVITESIIQQFIKNSNEKLNENLLKASQNIPIFKLKRIFENYNNEEKQQYELPQKSEKIPKI